MLSSLCVCVRVCVWMCVHCHWSPCQHAFHHVAKNGNEALCANHTLAYNEETSSQLSDNNSVCLFFSGYSTYPYELLQVPSQESTAISASFTSDPLSPTPSKQNSASTIRKIVTFDPDNKDSGDFKQSNLTLVNDGDRKGKEDGMKTPVLQTTPPVSSTPTTATATDTKQHEGEALSQGMAHASSTASFAASVELHSASFSPLVTQTQYVPLTKSVLLSKDGSASTRPEFGSKEEEFIAGLLPPEQAVTVSGMAIVKDLFLPPPPPVDISTIATPSTTTLNSLNTQSSLNAPSPTSSKSSLKSVGHRRYSGLPLIRPPLGLIKVS